MGPLVLKNVYLLQLKTKFLQESSFVSGCKCHSFGFYIRSDAWYETDRVKTGVKLCCNIQIYMHISGAYLSRTSCISELGFLECLYISDGWTECCTPYGIPHPIFNSRVFILILTTRTCDYCALSASFKTDREWGDTPRSGWD